MSGGWGIGNWFGGSNTTAKNNQNTKNAILKLRETHDMLMKREKHLQNQMDEQDAIARKYVTTNKSAAKTALKRKKQFEIQVTQMQDQMSSLESQIYVIESANINKETMGALSGATKALKNIHKDLTPDKVDQTMEDLREANALNEEINTAIAQGNPASAIDESELEDELAELQQEELDNKMLHTGTVPVGDRVHHMPNAAVGELPSGRQRAEEYDEEEELRKLQAEMAV